MDEFVCTVIKSLILLPGMLLAYLPMKQQMRMSHGRTAAVIVSLSVLLCLANGGLSYAFSANSQWIFLLMVLIAGLIYILTLRVSLWKSVSVFLAVCGVFSCLGSTAKTLALILFSENTKPWLSIGEALLYNLLCWLFVALALYPATHAARELLEDEAFAQTWFVFWILPLLFIVLNLFISPVNPEIVYQGRIIQIYIVVNFVLLFLLLLFYTMFYLIASTLNRNQRLRQENQFLSMQQTQYDNLRTSIEETRKARHDMRHHFDALISLASRKEWDRLEKYLSDVRGNIPSTEMNLCENAIVDGVAGHYGLMYRKHNIPFVFELDLPKELPVPEVDLCVVLSNLLENALEASLNTAPERRYIKAQAYLHSDNMLLLTVENVFDGTVKEKNGIFLSSKRKGEGIGIQSVSHIAEKSGGYCRFTQSDNIFYANVILRGESTGNL